MENRYRKNNNKCIDCNIEIDDRAKRCHSCHIKYLHKMGKLNNKDKKHGMYKDGRTLKKYFCQDCQKELKNIYVERCKSCSLLFYYKNHPNIHKGDNNPAFTTGITLQKYFCIDCKKQISLNNFLYGLKRCKSCSHKGKLSIRFGKPAPHGKGSYYKNIWMRSSYEIAYSKYLDKNKIKWLYEPKTFDLGDTTYTPDFYLPKTKEYIEIKGYIKPNFKNKLYLLKKQNKKINITILFRQELRELKLIK